MSINSLFRRSVRVDRLGRFLGILIWYLWVESLSASASAQPSSQPMAPVKAPYVQRLSSFMSPSGAVALPAIQKPEYDQQTDALIKIYVDEFNKTAKTSLKFEDVKKKLTQVAAEVERTAEASTNNQNSDYFANFLAAAKSAVPSVYNKAFSNPLDKLYLGKTQCDGSTEFQNLIYRLRPSRTNAPIADGIGKLDEQTSRPVAILQNGHVLMGEIRSLDPDQDGVFDHYLFGYESTVNGKGKSNFGKLSDLIRSEKVSIPIPLEYYSLSKLGKDVTAAAQADLLKNYQLNVNALLQKARSASTFSSKSAVSRNLPISQWSFGSSDVPDGDLKMLTTDWVGGSVNYGLFSESSAEQKARLSDLEHVRLLSSIGKSIEDPNFENNMLFESDLMPEYATSGQSNENSILLKKDKDGRGIVSAYLQSCKTPTAVKPHLYEQILQTIKIVNGNVKYKANNLSSFEGDRFGQHVGHHLMKHLLCSVNKENTFTVSSSGWCTPADFDLEGEGKLVDTLLKIDPKLMGGLDELGNKPLDVLANGLPNECSPATAFQTEWILKKTSTLDCATVKPKAVSLDLLKQCVGTKSWNSNFKVQFQCESDTSKKVKKTYSEAVSKLAEESKLIGQMEAKELTPQALELGVNDFDVSGNSELEQIILNPDLTSKDILQIYQKNRAILKPLATLSHPENLYDPNSENEQSYPFIKACTRNYMNATKDELKANAMLAVELLGEIEHPSAMVNSETLSACLNVAAKANNQILMDLIQDKFNGGNPIALKFAVIQTKVQYGLPILPTEIPKYLWVPKPKVRLPDYRDPAPSDGVSKQMSDQRGPIMSGPDSAPTGVDSEPNSAPLSPQSTPSQAAAISSDGDHYIDFLKQNATTPWAKPLIKAAKPGPEFFSEALFDRLSYNEANGNVIPPTKAELEKFLTLAKEAGINPLELKKDVGERLDWYSIQQVPGFFQGVDLGTGPSTLDYRLQQFAAQTFLAGDCQRFLKQVRALPLSAFENTQSSAEEVVAQLRNCRGLDDADVNTLMALVENPKSPSFARINCELPKNGQIALPLNSPSRLALSNICLSPDNQSAVQKWLEKEKVFDANFCPLMGNLILHSVNYCSSSSTAVFLDSDFFRKSLTDCKVKLKKSCGDICDAYNNECVDDYEKNVMNKLGLKEFSLNPALKFEYSDDNKKSFPGK